MKSSDFKNIPKKFELGTIVDFGDDFSKYYKIKYNLRGKNLKKNETKEFC